PRTGSKWDLETEGAGAGTQVESRAFARNDGARRNGDPWRTKTWRGAHPYRLGRERRCGYTQGPQDCRGSSQRGRTRGGQRGRPRGEGRAGREGGRGRRPNDESHFGRDRAARPGDGQPIELRGRRAQLPRPVRVDRDV